jgi:hypothetical protein
MSFGKIEQLGGQLQGAPGTVGLEAGKNYFEKEKRPNYRYYYHGSFVPFLDKIEKSGTFKFKEHIPNITISPIFSYDFLDEKEKGQHWTVSRVKHLPAEEKDEIITKGLDINDGVMLVIEPSDEFMAHSSTEGRPNVFSTPDQIPADINEVIRTRIWNQYQHAMSKESIAATRTDDFRHHGMDRGRKMKFDGTWEQIPEEQRLNMPAEMPASSIKMAIKKTPEFLDIFYRLREKLSEGGEIDLTLYKNELIEYFKSGQGIVKDEVANKEELAENMVTGELEHSIVTTIRNLYLNFEAFKGKKVVNSRTHKEIINPIKTKEQLLEEIRILNSLELENEVLKRYIQVSVKNIENELNSQ